MNKIFINGKEVEFNPAPLNYQKPTYQSKYLIIPEERIGDLITFLQDFKKSEGNKVFLAIKGIEKDFNMLDDESVIANMSIGDKDFTMCSFSLEINERCLDKIPPAVPNDYDTRSM